MALSGWLVFKLLELFSHVLAGRPLAGCASHFSTWWKDKEKLIGKVSSKSRRADFFFFFALILSNQRTPRSRKKKQTWRRTGVVGGGGETVERTQIWNWSSRIEDIVAFRHSEECSFTVIHLISTPFCVPSSFRRQNPSSSHRPPLK